MSIIATGSKTIIDLSDGKSLSVHLGSNQPRFQIKDSNSGSDVYTPNWSTSNLVITPVVYANSTAVSLSDSHLSTTWKRKEGSGSESNLTTNESVSSNVLTVSANKLSSVTSGLLTYIVTVSYTDPDTAQTIQAQADITFALVRTGDNAKTCWISGDQVFKYSTTSTVTPSSITLTANVQNVTVVQWWYYNESTSQWTQYPTTSDNVTTTGSTLVIKPTHSIWNGDRASIKVTTNNNDVYDTTSIYKVSDGAAGTLTPTVFLTNENIGFVGNSSGEVAATTVTCNVVAYSGTTKVTPTVGTITGCPTGMSATAGSASSNEIPITISVTAGSTLGSSSQTSGSLSVPVTSPVSTTLTISWSKINTGAAGAQGASAVVFSVYAPDGDTFRNQEGTLTLQTQAYDGSTAIVSGATYQWAKYASGSWTNISGATNSSYTVNGSDVNGLGSYRCTMTYGGKSYVDVITLEDKTDNYQAEIFSTAGDVFKNTVGSTCLICNLWQNGSQVDAVKSTVYSTTAPTSPATGDFYYAITTSTPVTKLMRYSGSAWVDVTSNATYKHTKTYTWYRRDSSGDPLDSGNAFATGKVIYIDGDDVDNKTVFVCEVE